MEQNFEQRSERMNPDRPSNEPLVDSPVYSRIMFALINAHWVVTGQVVDGRLPARLDPVLEAIDAAILATQEARHGN